MINQHISGTPKAQPRVKAYSRGGRAGVYTPKTADAWKKTVAASLAQFRGRMLDTPFAVSLTFYLPRPKSHFGTGKNSETLKAKAPKYHTQKPDCDNLEKAILDTLTSINFWKDDSQVVKLTTQKKWASEFCCTRSVDSCGRDRRLIKKPLYNHGQPIYITHDNLQDVTA